jgi:hypothetical protein
MSHASLRSKATGGQESEGKACFEPPSFTFRTVWWTTCRSKARSKHFFTASLRVVWAFSPCLLTTSDISYSWLCRIAPSVAECRWLPEQKPISPVSG